MRRGMMQQVFLFLFALIMMALILVFGIKNLFVVTHTAGTVETLSFIEDFKKMVQTYYDLDVGSSKYVKLSVPKDMHQICFSNPALAISGISDPVFKALLQSDKKDNMYLLPLEQFQSPGPGFFIPHLYVRGPKNPLCVLTQDGLHVVIETISVDNTIMVEVKTT